MENERKQPDSMTLEEQRLEESRQRRAHWKRWGPYVSERQWGTVREDYSSCGSAWDYFPHDHARSRAYRWGEDGLAGISDRHQLICFALALWNGKDPILKERLFGLTGSEGNHGEDVKEYYYYLDSTPTHSYMKFLYKYPQSEFPYALLVEENRRRGRNEFEFELMDTGVFDADRYFDVFVEYAKASPEDILIQITAHNRGLDAAELHLLPTFWFRNTWAWNGGANRPALTSATLAENAAVIEAQHAHYGKRWLLCEGMPELLFTENETNNKRLFGVGNRSPYVKDGINDCVVYGNRDGVNPAREGTKAAAVYRQQIEPGSQKAIRLRLTDKEPRVVRCSAPAIALGGAQPFGNTFDDLLSKRRAEADEFYARRTGQASGEDAAEVQRQAFAGLLWSKQFYHCDLSTWIEGDPSGPPPPVERKHGRNREWNHLYNEDVISMPDKWEYPWYASWDLAFHCVTLALIDPDFAKEQLLLFLREWYMHPNGQLPAYEWAFGDVNPPVHAWAAWRVYKIERRIRGQADRSFLARVFQKLLLNFTWWVNRKDAEDMNIFQGGFLGLDNIGVFDRSAPLPTGGHIEQSDGTSWMGMYCLNMLAIALELAKEDRTYGDVASKFFEHFVYISDAMNNRGGHGIDLWDEEDGFYYDVLHLPDGSHHQLKVRSMVGLIPLFAVETLEPEIIDVLPGFKKRMLWFIENRPRFRTNVTMAPTRDGNVRHLLSIVSAERLPRVLRVLLDENEFLAPYGIRALSQFHRNHPYVLQVDGHEYRVEYQPAESNSGLFGGNSNWRGPIWFPLNYLLIESLQKFHYFFGGDIQADCPYGSGHLVDLREVAADLSRRLVRIFLRDDSGRRPVYGGLNKFQSDPHWRDLIQFHEYFHGDNGAGIGASHQTGWTALVAKLIEQSGAPKCSSSRTG
jgi:hypothetical protein